jgi:predicted dithiol-disulfide oxidoreductase (DUF899 family)
MLTTNRGGAAVAEHRIGTREEWLAARTELLEREKELTRRSDELARERQELPWVPVEKEYVFETNDGPRTLAELFDGRSQLLVYHFMHGPNTPEGCVGCTFGADHWSGAVPHLNAHGVTFVFASRSPLEVLNAYKERMGWTVPWVSSGGTGFNLDFSLFTEEDRRGGTGFNFGTPKRAGMHFDDMELMALSAFALEDGVVYHTYSCFDRGTDVLIPTWQFLDRAPKGRLDGGADAYAGSDWPQRHDEYPAAAR